MEMAIIDDFKKQMIYLVYFVGFKLKYLKCMSLKYDCR